MGENLIQPINEGGFNERYPILYPSMTLRCTNRWRSSSGFPGYWRLWTTFKSLLLLSGLHRLKYSQSLSGSHQFNRGNGLVGLEWRKPVYKGRKRWVNPKEKSGVGAPMIVWHHPQSYFGSSYADNKLWLWCYSWGSISDVKRGDTRHRQQPIHHTTLSWILSNFLYRSATETLCKWSLVTNDRRGPKTFHTILQK